MRPAQHKSALLERVLWGAQFAPLGLIVLMLALQCLQAQPYPQDDLLRNVTAYAWGFDYNKLYPFAPGMPHFDPYLGFDWLFGRVSQAFGPSTSIVVAQLSGAGALLAALLAPLHQKEDRVFRATVAIALVAATLVTSRLAGGRPEIWATVWLLSAASLPPRIWLLLGVLLSPAYWLMPLYAFGALMLQAPVRQRLLYLLLALVGTSLFWLSYAGMEWIHTGVALPTLNHRPIPAIEAGPLRNLLGYPGTWLLLAGLATTILWHRKRLQHWSIGFPVMWFLLIGSVRHILVLAPLVAMWVALQPWPRPRVNAWSVLAFLALAAGLMSAAQLPGHQGPRLQVPAGGVVLSGYNPGVFYLPFHNPGTFSMAPSIESGWDTPQAVALAQQVTKGTLTCAALEGTSFTYVLTKEAKPLTGPCFSVFAKEPGWTLWARAQVPPRKLPVP
jgi:MFS family permease